MGRATLTSPKYCSSGDPESRGVFSGLSWNQSSKVFLFQVYQRTQSPGGGGVFSGLIKSVDNQQTILILLQKCITPLYSSLFVNNLWPESTELLDTRQITINKFHRTEWTDWGPRYCWFLRIYTVMSWINFIFTFSSGLEIFSTFNVHHPI